MSLLRRHFRMLVSLGIGGLLAGASLWLGNGTLTDVLFGVNGFFASYLVLSLWLTVSLTPDDLRSRAEEDDEGVVLIVAISWTAVVVSLWAIIRVLNSPDEGALPAGMSLAAVPLGWAMVHTVAAFRYARLFYVDKQGCGLAFPGTKEPGPWDFLYFSFAIGTSTAVSDVDVESTRMRQLVMLHTTGTFFYNTVILALAVNAGLVLAGGES